MSGLLESIVQLGIKSSITSRDQPYWEVCDQLQEGYGLTKLRQQDLVKDAEISRLKRRQESHLLMRSMCFELCSGQHICLDQPISG